MTATDPSQLQLLNTFESFNKLYFQIQVIPCRGEGCASKPDVDDFLSSNRLIIFSTFGFIDFSNVQPTEQSLEKAENLIHSESGLGTPGRGNVRQLLLDENRAELFDDVFNFMGLATPKNIDYLTFSKRKNVIPQSVIADDAVTVQFFLSQEILVQKRVVYDIFMMLGDVGGLLDFFKLAMYPVFGFFANQFMNASLVQQLYHVSQADETA